MMPIGNAVLRTHVEQSLELLKTARDSLVRGDVHNVLDDDVFGRGIMIHQYLTAAVSLSNATMYPQASALLRSGLEAAVCDVLAFRHARVVIYRNLGSSERAQSWIDNEFPERAQDSPLELATLHLCRTKGCVELVQRADIETEPLHAARLLLVDQYQPFLRERRHFRTERYPDAATRRSQRQMKHVYHHYATFRSVAEQLVRLGGLTEPESELLQHHFDYLSLFVHPQTDPTTYLWPQDHGFGIRSDPWVDRIVLLYAAAVASIELDSLTAYVNARPGITNPALDEWARDELAQRQIRDVRAELRMPWTHSHPMDEYIEEVWRQFRERDRQRPADDRHFVEDDRPALDENVLTRLIRLHHGENEAFAKAVYGPVSSTITDY